MRENKVFGIKKNNGENLQIDIEIKIKINSQKTHFFEFSNTLKQIKIKLYNPKTLWNLAVKTLGKIENFALKNYEETNPRDGYL